MGSGKGKTRRVQAVLATLPAECAPAWAEEAVLDKSKWSDFVKNSDMVRTKVYPYYLGKSASSPPDYCNADHEKVVTELLADFVAVGAMVLPAPYTVEDFELKMIDGKHSWNQYFTVSMKSQPRLT